MCISRPSEYDIIFALLLVTQFHDVPFAAVKIVTR